MNRIIVLGRAGTGKTTLSREIEQVTGFPVICLDSIWQQGWTDAEVPLFRKLLEEAHASYNWVSDGNFAGATFDIRLPRATQIIWLDRSKLLCSWRAISRTWKRDEPHRMKGIFKVIQFIWKFDRVNRPLIEAVRLKHGPDIPVIYLSSDREVGEFLTSLR